jgi:hypothetical protein
VNRTTARRILPILAALLIAMLAIVDPSGVEATGAGPTGVEVTDPTEPPATTDDFFPEDRDVTECIGVLERPGCGNKNRGGWRQLLVFGLIAAGLTVVFTKITIEVRRGRAGTAPDSDDDPGPRDPAS